MVMPKLPFSLLDFERMNTFDLRYIIPKAAAAGDALTYTLYTCPDDVIAWLVSIGIDAIKTTGTALQILLERRHRAPKSSGYYQTLLNETIGTESVNWPSNKTGAVNSLANHLCFLWPKDYIYIDHALTIAETIDHMSVYHIIEYKDPRYEK